jgi:transcription antitermination factor NusG
MTLDWFAIRVKSNRERVTAQGLRGRGYEVFLPEYQVQGTCGRGREAALFPGYLFSRFDVTNRLPIVTLPGVVHIVGMGRTPIPVDAGELESLKVVVQAGLLLNPNEPYTVGEKVCVQQGPLAGACGVVVGHSRERLVVSISLLQRSVSVILNSEWIAPRSASRSAEAIRAGAS